LSWFSDQIHCLLSFATSPEPYHLIWKSSFFCLNGF
jgi:hypothetical protein